MSRTKLFVFAALLVGSLLIGTGVQAGEVPEILKKIDAKQYYPGDHGLEDLEVTIKNPQMQAMMPGVFFKLYWMAPDKVTVKVEGMEGDQQQMMARRLMSLTGQLAQLILPTPLTEMADDMEVSHEDDGDLIKVMFEGEKEGAKQKQTIWFTQDYKPVRMKQTANTPRGTVTSRMEMEVLEKDGTYLRKSYSGDVEMQMGKLNQSMKWEYKEFDGVWLPTSVSISTKMEGGQGMNMDQSYEISDHKVNQGLDSSIFGEDEEGEEGDTEEKPEGDPGTTQPRDDF